MKVYKLFKPDMTTYEGYQWKVGRKETIGSLGTAMCSRDVFHGYRIPELAVLMNPVHAKYIPAVLFQCEVPRIVVDDGTKIGFKKCTPLKQVSMPEVTAIISVRFGILAALTVCNKKAFKQWAENWLSGKNRSKFAADIAVTDIVNAAANVAADAAAAYAAAAYAADAAAYAAANVAADAAAAYAASSADAAAAYAASAYAADAAAYATIFRRKLDLCALAKQTFREQGDAL